MLARDAEDNMRRDGDLLAAAVLAGARKPLHRVYAWRGPAVSVGRSSLPVSVPGVSVTRRPTGGGILVHGTDVSIAVAVPDGWWALPRDLVAAGRILAVPVLDALRRLGFDATFRDAADCGTPCAADRPALCFLQRSALDIMIRGRKVAAFSQRRVRGAWFQHGSVLVDPVPPEWRASLQACDVGSPGEWARVDGAVAPLSVLGRVTPAAAGEAVRAAAERAWGASK